MKNSFKCPDCKGFLNIDESIIFYVRTKMKPGALLILTSEPGDYTVKVHPSLDYEEGETFDFYCPICLKHLASDKHENLAKILMVDEENQEYEVYFSRRAGEQSTFKIIGENTEYFGKDATLYTDIFNSDLMP